MKNLIRLSFIKKKAKIRSIFKKPVSAIFTVVIIAMYGCMFIPVFQAKGKLPIDELMTNIYIMFVLGATLLICLLTLMQKRQALFFEEDSYYLFIGPFTNRQILAYSIVDVLFISFVTALFCVAFPLLSVAIDCIVPISYILLGIFISTLIIFLFMMMSQYIYLNDLIREKKSKARTVIGLGFILVIVGLLGYFYFVSGLDIKAGMIDFLLSKEFYFVPIIGWAKYALEGLFTNDLLAIFAGTGLLIVASGILFMMTMGIKGYFYEQAMVDAVDFSEFYKKAVSGEVVENKNKKYHKATVWYRKGEGALLSKSLLVLKKSRTIFTKQDLMSLVSVAIVGSVIVPNFVLYGALVLVYLMNSSGSASLIEELKVNYIYLIPGSPFKKLLNMLVIPVVKTMILSIVMMAASYFMFEISLVELLAGMGIMVSFVLVFYTGNVVSIRLLKSRTNKMLEMTLRMLIIALTCTPSAGLLWLFYHFTGNLLTNLAIIVPMAIGFNVIISMLLICACSSMMNGNAYVAD